MNHWPNAGIPLRIGTESGTDTVMDADGYADVDGYVCVDLDMDAGAALDIHVDVDAGVDADAVPAWPVPPTPRDCRVGGMPR